MLSCAFLLFLSSLFISVYSLWPHLSPSFIWGHPSPLYIPFTCHCPSFTLFTSPHSFLPPSHPPTSSLFLPLPPSLISSSGLWARAAPTPTCWTCRVAPTRNECVAARFSTPRSCTKTLRWPERWSSTCLTWRWRQTRRNNRSCRCSASRPTAPVSNTETQISYSSVPSIFPILIAFAVAQGGKKTTI